MTSLSSSSTDAAGGFAYLSTGGIVPSCTTPAMLKVDKSPQNGAFAEGSQASFTIVVSNPAPVGAGNAYSVKLTDVLPGNGGLVWHTATTTQGSCVNPIVNNTLNCSLGYIMPQKQVTVKVMTALVTPPSACQFQANPAAIATASGGLTAQDSAALTCTPAAKLSVVKSPKNGTFIQGGQASYKIVVSNPAAAGSSSAVNVQLKDQLPGNGGMVWTGAHTTAGECSLASNLLTCSLGDIPPGGSVTVDVNTPATTPPAACQYQPNLEAVATADGGLRAEDSGSLVCTPLSPAKLAVAVTPDNGSFTLGSQVSYHIVVSNPAPAGSGAAQNVQLTDQLPTNGGLIWTNVATSQGACSITNNTLNCGLGSIPAGGSVNVTVSSPLTTPASACLPQPNPAAIATADGGLTAQDSGSQSCTSGPPGQLKVVKTPDNGPFTQGSQVSFKIVVSNPAAAGSAPARNVKLTDPLPTNGGMTWTSFTTTQGTCSIVSNVLDCSLGDILPGKAVTVYVYSPQTTPISACQAQASNATATADGGLTWWNSGSLICTPVPSGQLRVVKTPDNGIFTQGSQVSFNIVVSNPSTTGPATNVQLTDQLPTNGGLTWSTATTTQGTCSVVSNALNCALGNIPAGGSVTVTVSSPSSTPASACQQQINCVAVATADGGLTAQDSGSLSCVPAPSGQLRVVKTPDNGIFTSGSQVSFNIVVSNPSTTGPALNVRLTDQLPTNGGLTWTTFTTTQGTCSLVSSTLNCTLGNIPAGGSVTVTVSSPSSTPATACQLQTNCVAVATADGGLSAQDSGSLNCSPALPPQLKVVKGPDNGVFTQGSQVTFRITVSNSAAAGSAPLQNVMLTDQLPTNGGLTWTSFTTTQGTCSLTDNYLSCSLGSIPAGQSVIVYVRSPQTTPASACQPQINPRALVTADGGLTAWNSGSLYCTPPATPPQLRVVKTPDNGTFTQGSQVSFNIVVSNPAPAGSSAATNVLLTDQLPVNGGMTWTSATASQGNCSITNNILSCSLGSIPAVGSVNVGVSSPATTPAAACQPQPNVAAIATADGGLSAQDGGSLTCTPSAPPAQLRVVKGPDNGVFTQGAQVTFRITVSNPAPAGSLAAGNVMLTDLLPTAGGLTWTSATTTQGSCSITNNNLSCSLGSIPAGQSVVVIVSSPATTPASACQPQINPRATATADGGLTAWNSGSLYCTPPTTPPQLRVVKTPDNGTFIQGAQVSYSIVVSNPAAAGSSPAENVTLADQLPTNGGLSWTSVTTSQGSCSITGSSLNCSLGSITAGGSVIVVVSSPASTPLAACQPQPNPAAIATASGGLTAQDSGSLTCLPPPPQLRVVKTPDNGTFTQGSQASFNIVVSNPAAAGSGPAVNVVLTDQLPTNGGLTWTTATTTQGSCSITGNTLNCSLGTILAGGSVNVVVSTPPTTPMNACQSQPNPAAIATAQGGLTAQDSGSLSCAPAPCIIPAVTISNTSWNSFNVPQGTNPVVWVHAHIGTPSGIPTNTTTSVLFTNASISLNGTVYPLPDGLMIFDPSAPATMTTTYNAALDRWETVVNPRYMSNEMFFTGAAIPVTPEIAAGAKATFTYTVVSQAPDLAFPWQWSAAVYTYWPSDWNQAQIQPYHQSYHAGTPLNRTVQESLIGGPRGGGGSNFTGSWSATGNGVCP